jgi:hypothetical protein
LAKITSSETHDDWDLKLDIVLMGYRASRQASTKFSPFYMLFQKEMRLPIHNEICPVSEGELQSEVPETGGEVVMSGSEASPESGAEVSPESGGEVSPESGGEVSPESGGKVSPESGGEVSGGEVSGGEVSPESGGEVSPESGGEVSPESGGEVSPESGVSRVR